MLQQSRKFAAMSSSSAISGGIGNSGISVDELVYLEWDISMPTPFDGTHLVLYVKYMQTFCKTWLGISLKLTWKKSWAIGRQMLSTSFVSFSANCPGPESMALIVPGKVKWIFKRAQPLVNGHGTTWGESMVPGNYELMSIRADELDIPDQKNELHTKSKIQNCCWTNYIASGPSQPPKVLASPPTSIAESLAVIFSSL